MTRLQRAFAASALVATCCNAVATDVATASLPSDIADATVQVAQRRLHLPAGHWVLVAREEVETVGSRGRTGTGLQVWVARADGGPLGALLKLSLPQQEFHNAHQRSENRCPEENGIQRVDLSPNPALPECLGVYGHRDLLQAMATRSPAVSAWMANAQVANPGAMVRFTYRQRTDFGYGGISLFLPTAHFDSDDAAAAWARRLREACRPLFEGRVWDADLPAPPALVSEADGTPAN